MSTLKGLRSRSALLCPGIATALLLTGHQAYAACQQFTPTTSPVDPSAIELVRTIGTSGQGLTSIIDLKQAVEGSLASFLEEGGSFVFKNEAGEEVGILNSDNAPSYQLGNAVSGVVAVGQPATNAQAELPPGWIASLIWRTRNRLLLGAAPGAALKRFDLRVPGSAIGIAPNETFRLNALFKAMEPQQLIGPFDGNLIPPRGDLLNANQVTLPLGQGPGGIRIDGADAIAAISFSATDQVGTTGTAYCHGIQFAPGRILTNLHCVQPGTDNHEVHFGRIHRRKISGKWVVKGQTSCTAEKFRPDQETFPRLDFAVLTLEGTPPARFASALLSLDDGQILSQRLSSGQGGTASAMQIQYWINGTAGGKMYEKYRFSPPACRIVAASPAPQANDICRLGQGSSPSIINPAGLAHLCDTDGGGSGSGLIDPVTGKILALHRGAGGDAGEFTGVDTLANCAVPAGAIAPTLRAWRLLN